jgi:6-phosphofructokinase 2
VKPITTLTLNPAIDVACDADEVRHTQKTRTFNETLEPGGGGINVARALCGFAAPVRAIYLAGGASGRVLDGMIAERGIAREPIWIHGETRISLNVRERASGSEFRFVPEGPEVQESEWRQVLDRVEAADFDYFVASGSLPPGIPSEFYADVAALTEAKGARFMLDTSGDELKAALSAGVFLVKPSSGELEQFVGRKLPGRAELAEAAGEIVAHGHAELVAVTLGHAGAILVSRDAAYFLPAVDVEVKSAVGAGDSFLAGMTYGLAAGHELLDAFRMAVAAGASAIQSVGTDLCKTADVNVLLARVGQPKRLLPA